MSFHVGQKVVYLGPSTGADQRRHQPLIKGKIYTVHGYCKSLHQDDLLGIFVCEEATFAEGPWCECFMESRFRPVVERKTDISIFTKMLLPQRELALTAGQTTTEGGNG